MDNKNTDNLTEEQTELFASQFSS